MVFDTVEKQDIRGLDIDKLVKGFALTQFTFKTECLVSSTDADTVRFYRETSADLTATSPSSVSGVGALSTFPTLEHSWERNTAVPIKFAAEGFISMEDIKTADIDVLSRTILRLTRAVMKAVDLKIIEAWIADAGQTFATTSIGGDQWDAASFAAEIVNDILHAKKLLSDNGYNPEGASLILTTADMVAVTAWLISGKGSSIPDFSSQKIESGTVMRLLGLNVKVSVNARADTAIVIIPQVACTWKSQMPMTARTIEDVGIGTKIRVWESGIPIVTDTNAICTITDTVTA